MIFFMNRKRTDGYSLVEVCLALLVAGLGVMVVFALFPEGLSQSRKAVDATEIGAFADYVFAGLTARAWTNNPAAWTDFGNGQLTPSLSLDPGDQAPVVIPANYSMFYWKPDPLTYGSGSGPRQTKFVANYRVASFTYSLVGQDVATNTKGVRLEVWPGDMTNLPGKVFYREFTPIR
jgi:hypothetical protein